MSAPQAVDWFRLLWDMVQRGHKLTHIADRTGIAHGTLRRYLHDSQPPHWRGVLLIEMWAETTGNKPEDVPMAELSLSPRVAPSRDCIRAEGHELEGAWK